MLREAALVCLNAVLLMGIWCRKVGGFSSCAGHSMPCYFTESFVFNCFFYSGRDVSHPAICFLIHSHFPGPVQETVGGAGFELGTAASSV
jgi:hypothetical protein